MKSLTTRPVFYQLPTFLLLFFRKLTVCHGFIASEQYVSRQQQQQQLLSLSTAHPLTLIHHPQQYRPCTNSRKNPSISQQQYRCRCQLYATIQQQEPPPSTVMSGVTDFESWFRSIPGAKCDPSIQHDDFGNLRGLGYNRKKKDGGQQQQQQQQRKEWMTIPRSIVLQSDFNQVDWDCRLAQNLWQEILRGKSSTVSGYTSVLVRGWTINELPNLPPSTANDSLRHWTEDEKSVLASTGSGQRLLDLQKKQEEMWRNKFSTVNGMTWEQFVWAMEVVHSRAFCGDFGIGGGSSILPPAVTIASPIVAAIAGYTYYVPVHGQDDMVLLGIGIVAAIPTLINVLSQKPPVAVLLPYIDSANHFEEADTSIEYNSLTDSFNLVSGGGPNSSNCIIKESNGKEQLYISYGKKKDSELLLNYGFLRGVPTDGDASTRRKQLATKFLQNNKDSQ
jgi:hypothetical protein